MDDWERKEKTNNNYNFNHHLNPQANGWMVGKPDGREFPDMTSALSSLACLAWSVLSIFSNISEMVLINQPIKYISKL